MGKKSLGEVTVIFTMRLHLQNCWRWLLHWLVFRPSFTMKRCFSLSLVVGLFAASNLFAQSLSSSVIAQRYSEFVGNRVEAATILGGDYGAAGGLYDFSGGRDTEVSITKLGGGGVITSPQDSGFGTMKWAPMLLGNIGYVTSDNEYTTGLLRGNRSESSFYSVQGGAGARFYFGDHFSLSPEVSLIYGHTENEFIASNSNGRLFKSLAGGDFVDWELETLTLLPAVEARYEWNWGRTVLRFSSRFGWFRTDTLESSTDFIEVEGESVTWENKLDVDVPLGVKLFGREMHTGGYLSRTEIGGDAADGLGTDYLHTLNGRLVLDMTGTIRGLRWLGIGASYSQGEDVDGWSFGMDVRLKF